MNNTYDQLIGLLKQHSKLVSGSGELLKNLTQDLARKNDSELIKLLLSNDNLKKVFFTSLDDVLIFNHEKFIRFITSKQFLPNSLSTYKNKIGLTTGDNYLAESKEVVLSWVHKDCILEAGMTKSDQSRSEVFYNEILAPDEVNRLLDPKSFINVKLIDSNGEHSVTKFNRNNQGLITDNLIIKGNNLLGLSSIEKEFGGSVKLIYIDPPYNTGGDDFQYNDAFNHATWLVFMKNRLEIAKRLLSDDGAIFVQCDDHEQAYLKVLLDEVFGKDCFRECIVVRTSTPSGVNAVNVKRGERLFKLKEYLLFYSKQSQYRFKPIYIRADYNLNYRYEVIKTEQGYTVTDLKKKFDNDDDLIEYCLSNPENIYSKESNNKKAGEKTKEALRESRKYDHVVEYVNTKNELNLLYKGASFVPLKERVISDGESTTFGTLISDLWDDQVFQTNSTEGGVNLPGAKKPEKLIKRILDITTNPGDIVLDYFLGSGTTCAVAHKMNRQYIGIEQLDYGENDSVVRLKNVISGEETGISKAVSWQGGGSFVYMELAEWNQKWIEKIRAAENTETLKDIWEEIQTIAFLSYRLHPTSINQKAKEFGQLSLAEQKQFLYESLDKNHLYINFSEIEDKEYGLSESYIALNRDFYRENK